MFQTQKSTSKIENLSLRYIFYLKKKKKEPKIKQKTPDCTSGYNLSSSGTKIDKKLYLESEKQNLRYNQTPKPENK